MHLSNVLLRILWEKPNENLAYAFVAETTRGYVLPQFPAGLQLVGNDNLGTLVTLFALPDGTLHLGPAGTIGDLFDKISTDPTVELIEDKIEAWVFVSGEVRLRGQYATEQYVVRKAADKLYSDEPIPVLVLDWVRFLSVKEIDDLETLMDQPV